MEIRNRIPSCPRDQCSRKSVSTACSRTFEGCRGTGGCQQGASRTQWCPQQRRLLFLVPCPFLSLGAATFACTNEIAVQDPKNGHKIWVSHTLCKWDLSRKGIPLSLFLRKLVLRFELPSHRPKKRDFEKTNKGHLYIFFILCYSFRISTICVCVCVIVVSATCIERMKKKRSERIWWNFKIFRVFFFKPRLACFCMDVSISLSQCFKKTYLKIMTAPLISCHERHNCWCLCKGLVRDHLGGASNPLTITAQLFLMRDTHHCRMDGGFSSRWPERNLNLQPSPRKLRGKTALNI